MLAEDIARLMAMVPHEEVNNVPEPLVKGRIIKRLSFRANNLQFDMPSDLPLLKKKIMIQENLSGLATHGKIRKYLLFIIWD